MKHFQLFIATASVSALVAVACSDDASLGTDESELGRSAENSDSETDDAEADDVETRSVETDGSDIPNDETVDDRPTETSEPVEQSPTEMTEPTRPVTVEPPEETLDGGVESDAGTEETETETLFESVEACREAGGVVQTLSDAIDVNRPQIECDGETRLGPIAHDGFSEARRICCPEPVQEAAITCDDIVDRRFCAITPKTCEAPPPMGLVDCYSSIRFGADAFEYAATDTVYVGSYSCDGTMLTEVVPDGVMRGGFEGTLGPEPDTLTFAQETFSTCDQ